jgi:colanic acid biosynthesis glycosyl transferase WcaI
VLYDTSFAISALLAGILTGPCDAVIAISPPLQLGASGWCLSLLKRVPFLLHIQDLVPDAAVATGMLSESGRAVKLARQLERFVYARARRIGVICDGFSQNLLAKGVPGSKILLLPNYIDLVFMRSMDRNNDFRQRQGLDEKVFIVMYSGSVALKQGLDTFVAAAAELRDHSDIVFFLVGEGPYVYELTAQAERLQLTNIRFLPLQPRENLPGQLAAADALVITQRKAVTDVVFPGKLLYYMAAGRPVVAAVSADSETGRFVQNNQIGMVVPPEDPISLANAILDLRRENNCGLGENARRVAEAQFDRRVVLGNFADQIELLAELRGHPASHQP